MANPLKKQVIANFNKKQGAPPPPQIAKLSPAQLQQLAPPKNVKNLQAGQQQVAQNVANANPQVPGQNVQQQQQLTPAQQIKLMAMQNKQVRQQQQAQLVAARKAQEDAANQVERVGMAADDAAQTIGAVTAPGVRWLSRLPTPGGIATMLLILAFFLLAVFPVNANGDTRLKLLWLTLTGKTHLRYSGSSTSTPATNTVGGTTRPATPGAQLVNTDASGNCPTGYDRVTVSGGKVMCELAAHGGPSPNGHMLPISPNIDIFGVMGFGN